MKVLITGAAGFIGSHLVQRMVQLNDVEIIGIDNINDYYTTDIKYSRLNNCGIEKQSINNNTLIRSKSYLNYSFCKMELTDYPSLDQLFRAQHFDVVVNLAAQAGVRYSIENPHAYVQSNLVGFANILECCRHHAIRHLVYASSSSVYGAGNHVPFSETDDVSYPISFYAATKKSNELMAHSYSHIFHLPTTGVRLFTVYGPWGRPDMAPFLFANAIYTEKPIKVFNHGNLFRDFTYIDDIVSGITMLINEIPDENAERPFYQLFNIGDSHPVKLLDFIRQLEQTIGKKAHLEMLPMQPGEMHTTFADTSRIEKQINFHPTTPISKGIPAFIQWYESYYRIKEGY